jgi:hypothetical protein
VNFHSLFVFSRSTRAISPCVRNWIKSPRRLTPPPATFGLAAIGRLK